MTPNQLATIAGLRTSLVETRLEIEACIAACDTLLTNPDGPDAGAAMALLLAHDPTGGIGAES